MRITFWRPSSETSSRHRNPLFDPRTHIGPEHIGVDWLHCCSLGVFQFWLAELVGDLLDLNAFKCGGASNLGRWTMNFERMREEFFRWHKDEAKRGIHHSKMQKCTSHMFRTKKGKRICDLHGAETNGLLAFSEKLITKFGAVLSDDRRKWHDMAGSALRSLIEKIRQNPCVFMLAEAQGFCDDVGRHLTACDKLGVPNKPQHHFLVDMAARFLLRI